MKSAFVYEFKKYFIEKQSPKTVAPQYWYFKDIDAVANRMASLATTYSNSRGAK